MKLKDLDNAPIRFELTDEELKSISGGAVISPNFLNKQTSGFAIRNHAVKLSSGFAIRNHAVNV